MLSPCAEASTTEEPDAGKPHVRVCAGGCRETGITIVEIALVYSQIREDIMAKNEKTSKDVGKKASELLRDPKTPKKTKSVAGAALTQRPDKKKKK